MFTIDSEKLDEVIRIYNAETDPAASDDVIESTVLADWHEGDEHQDWLNDASAKEIADWLAAMTA